MIDLFADTGGVPLAFGQAGFNFAVAVEIDPAHCSIHDWGFSNAAPKCAVVVDSTREDIRERASIRAIAISTSLVLGPHTGPA